jgi:hypothetical protein
MGRRSGLSRKSGDYKKANRPFDEAIMALPEGIHGRIVEETAEWAKRFIRAFHAEVDSEALMEIVSERPDHNAAPEQAVIASRKDHYREIAPTGERRRTRKGFQRLIRSGPKVPDAFKGSRHARGISFLSWYWPQVVVG